MNLKELHDAIKDHPWRLSNDDKYWKTYHELLYQLSHEFYMAIKEDKTYFGAKEMIHDFNGAILNKKIDHIERCIGTIHEYIDTGKISFYYTNYDGVNITPGLPRLLKWVFEPEKTWFRPVFTLQELCDAINAIEWMQEAKPRYKEFQFGPYSTEKLNFLKEYRAKYYPEYKIKE